MDIEDFDQSASQDRMGGELGADREMKIRKSDLTQQKIVDAALELFREQGYDKTTMRAVAKRAGVSVGNAYYYFASKEELVQGYYALLLTSFSERVEPILQDQHAFRDRLEGVLAAWVENARPYHGFAGEFFRHAANPSSPLSPFSPESSQTRDATTDIYRRLVDGSHRLRVSEAVLHVLPEMLWMYQMGVVLYWVFDDSDGQTKTLQLIERTVPIVSRLVSLSKVPGLQSTAKDLVKLFEQLRH